VGAFGFIYYSYNLSQQKYRIEDSTKETTEAETLKFEIWRSNSQFNQVIRPSKTAI